VPRQLLAYLQLLRLPNVFTAIADVTMGYLVTQVAFPYQDRSASLMVPFLLLLATSVCLYLAGMVLNDLFDVEIDRKERPQRPLPSGRISLRSAAVLGYLLLIGGVIAGWLATWWSGDLRCGIVATLLAAAVFLYNRVIKQTCLGPVNMGSCRLLNVLLGMSTASGSWHTWHWLVAGGIGVYITGVTWFARDEAGISRRLQLFLATGVMWVAFAMLAWSMHFMPLTEALLLPRLDPTRWYLMWLILGVIISHRCWLAVREPTAKHVQVAVRQCIFSLVMLDTVACYAIRDLEGALLILPLLIPTMFLGRFIYAT